jgi:hypothetical protein
MKSDQDDDFAQWGFVAGIAMMLTGLIGLIVTWWKNGCFYCG